jgi:hypothetical protein
MIKMSFIRFEKIVTATGIRKGTSCAALLGFHVTAVAKHCDEDADLAVSHVLPVGAVGAAVERVGRRRNRRDRLLHNLG